MAVIKIVLKDVLLFFLICSIVLQYRATLAQQSPCVPDSLEASGGTVV